jgi:hypothetical protein
MIRGLAVSIAVIALVGFAFHATLGPAARGENARRR